MHALSAFHRSSATVLIRLVAMPRLRLALAQTNPVVGDLAGNADQIVDAARVPRSTRAPTSSPSARWRSTGYPIEDLASRPCFLRAARAAVERSPRGSTTRGSATFAVVVGHPDGPFEPRLLDTSATPRRRSPRTARASCRAGVSSRPPPSTTCRTTRSSTSTASSSPATNCSWCGSTASTSPLIICEDLWRDGGPGRAGARRGRGAAARDQRLPWIADKDEVRLPLVTRRATENDTIVAYVNIVGGQDDLVFDGDSVVVDGAGTILARAPQFRRAPARRRRRPRSGRPTPIGTGTCSGSRSTPRTRRRASSPHAAAPPRHRRAPRRAARSSGTRSSSARATTSRRTASGRSILGLSGGIDSAVCAAIAADAIGAGPRLRRVDAVAVVVRPLPVATPTTSPSGIGLHYPTEPIADLVAPVRARS